MQTILVVDDDEAVRKTILLGLEKNGYRVLEASNGWDGMVAARQEQLDLILCDMNLGLAGERGMLEGLKSTVAAMGVPFVLMTGQPNHESSEDVLAKPFTLPELLRHVRKRLKGRSKLQASPGVKRENSREQQPSDRKFREPRGVPSGPAFVTGTKLSREQLENLLARVQRLREEERTEVARDIHDDLTQTLTVLALELSFLESGLSSAQQPVNPEEYIPSVRKLSELVNALIRSAQGITAKLRPKVLDEFGFVAALEWLTGQVEQKTGRPCELVVEGGEIRLEKGTAGGLYRLSEEILAYAAQNARGPRLVVQVANEGGKLRVDFTDSANGRGSERSQDAPSLELLAMAEQAERLGGVLDFGRGNASGTMMSVTIPTES